MATNPMQRKARNSFLLGFMLMLIIAAVIIGFLVMQLAKIKQEEQEKEMASRNVYVLQRDVKSGETISTSDVSMKKVEGSSAPADYDVVIEEDTISKINLKKGTILSKSMLTESTEKITSDLRLQEFNMLALPVAIEVDDYIDIRFTLPSGVDYIVIPKKKVIDIQDNTIWLQLTEDEILTMSNAIYEAYTMPTSKLYINLYVEPGIQETATPTYPINSAVLELISKNPNVVATAKKALSDRLENLTNQRNNVINTELQNYSADAQTNVEERIKEENEKRQEAREKYLEELNGGMYTEEM